MPLRPRFPQPVPTSSTATARSSRPTSRWSRSSPSRATSSTRTRRSSSHRRAAGSRRHGPAQQARHEEGLRLGQARDHAAPAGRGAPPRYPGRRLPAREQARLSERARPPRTCSASPMSTMSASPASRNTSTAWACRISTAQASTSPPPISSRSSSPSICACSMPCATSLQKGMAKFKAKAAAGAILDVNTGEMIALVSLPDYDPNNPVDALEKDRINRINVGVFEMGSTFKALTTAMALDSGKYNINSTLRCALGPALWQVHDRRLSSDAARPHGAGSVHPFLQHRHGPHGARHRRRGAQGLPAQDGPARRASRRSCRRTPCRSFRRAGASSTP